MNLEISYYFIRVFLCCINQFVVFQLFEFSAGQYTRHLEGDVIITISKSRGSLQNTTIHLFF